MYNSDDRKDYRRKKILNKNLKKEKISEEQKFLSKSKKQKKQQMEYLKEEELWDDWENYQ